MYANRGFTEKDVPDQGGRTIVITGANTGLGYEAARVLAGKNARVIIACRSPHKAQAAIERILALHPEAEVAPLELDLSSLASVREAAAQLGREQRLDVLINNAGIMVPPYELTADGFESQFGVNHLGPFAFTGLLLDKIRATPGARIVSTSSIAHKRGKIHFDDINAERGYNAIPRYAQSKLANVLFTRELARRHPEINAYAVHPGPVRTRIGNKHSSWYASLFWHLLKVFMISAEKGAKTSVYLATSPELEGAGGQFFDDKQRLRTLSEAGRDEALARRLWEASEEMVTGK